ncbi:MAG: N-methyl-L-tryptophan oxidase [Chloroflexales bacterium]|nr:N-methyl-L-tryptophan oxidase [Chloroflexales bacterium]
MHYHTIIIGLGGMGSATAYHIARRGQRVLGLEQFTPAHSNGSSHGHSRIIRQAYMEHPSYVPLLKRAFVLWDELAAHSDEDLLHLTGGIMIGRPDSDAIQGTLASVREHQLPHQMLDAATIRQRYPALTPSDDIVAVYEDNAGFVVPEAAVRTHLRLAQTHGAELHFQEAVTHWQANPAGGVTVTTAQGVYTADHLVITPGAWAPELLADMGLPLRVERRVLLWFAPIGGFAPFTEPNFPIYIWDCGDGVSFYGFPYHPSLPGIKVAIHTVGQICSPDSIERQLQAHDVESLQNLLRERIPALLGPMIHYETCMYTLTPDEHFVIAVHPDHPQVVIASPCSGHGFKFTPVIGEILADLAIDGHTKHDISLFSLRF